jgi:hypothetical protein
MVHVERCLGSGLLNLKVRGVKLKNTDDMFRKSDQLLNCKMKKQGQRRGWMGVGLRLSIASRKK